MSEPRVYEIRVAGHLTDRWSDWFEGLAIQNEPGGETTLRGPLADQAALFGLLAKIQSLNLVLLGVAALPDEGVAPRPRAAACEGGSSY